MRRGMVWSRLVLGALAALAMAPAGWAYEALGDPTPNGENMRIQYLRPALPDGTRAAAWVEVPSAGLYVAVGTAVQFRAVRDDGQAWPAGQPTWKWTAGAVSVTGTTGSPTWDTSFTVASQVSTDPNDASKPPTTTTVTCTTDLNTCSFEVIVRPADNVTMLHESRLGADGMASILLRATGAMWTTDGDEFGDRLLYTASGSYDVTYTDQDTDDFALTATSPQSFTNGVPIDWADSVIDEYATSTPAPEGPVDSTVPESPSSLYPAASATVAPIPVVAAGAPAVDPLAARKRGNKGGAQDQTVWKYLKDSQVWQQLDKAAAANLQDKKEKIWASVSGNGVQTYNVGGNGGPEVKSVCKASMCVWKATCLRDMYYRSAQGWLKQTATPASVTIGEKTISAKIYARLEPKNVFVTGGVSWEPKHERPWGFGSHAETSFTGNTEVWCSVQPFGGGVGAAEYNKGDVNYLRNAVGFGFGN